MRKFICVIAAVLLLTVSVFGAEFSGGTGYDTASNKIVIEYSGYGNEEMAILVYDVTGIESATSETLWQSLSRTPVIGIDQSVADGTFEIPVSEDFTGRVVILLSGENSDCVRMLMEITNGIPDSITVDYDAQNAERTLKNDEEIIIANGAKLFNAMVDARLGQVMYGDTKLTGNMIFDESGDIDAALGYTVKLEVSDGNGGTHQGFIKKDTLTGSESNYTVTLRASGTADGKTYNSTKDVVFEFGNNLYEGEARFRIVVQNVPDGVTITEE